MLINLSTIIGVFLGVLLGVFVSTLLFRNKVKILKSNLEKTNNELKSTKIEAQADLEMVEAYWSTRLSEEKAKDKKHYEAALADKDKANDEAMQILREYCEYLLRIQRDEGGVLDQIADKDHKIAWLAYQVDRLKWQLVLAYREELEPFMQCYIEKKKATDRQTAELSEKIITLRRKLRSGELDNKQYQKQITPLKKEKKQIAATLDHFVYQALNKPFPEHNITVEEIEKYLEETREWEQKRHLLPRFRS